jgi:hypothetical protein
MDTIVGFGDSWTFGSELDHPDKQCWLAQLSTMMNTRFCNMSTPASSIGHLSVQLFDFVKNNPNFEDNQLIFMVGLTGLTRYLSYSNAKGQFVSITPEAVYCTKDIHSSGRPPENLPFMDALAKQTYMLTEDAVYNEFLVAQQISLFQQFCNYNEIDCIFFSYFDMPTFNNYGHMIVKDLVYPTSITQALTGQEYSIPKIRDNKYFTGKLFHPNIDGHTRIAELLRDFYDQKYPRN